VQRLLVIEDEPEIRKVVSRALSSARFQTDCAADGRSGAREGPQRPPRPGAAQPHAVRPGRGGQRRADRQGRQADTAEDFHADAEGHERVDRVPGHHQADGEVARS
jgi:CheY-like chemotaxis protein